jgi:sensor c-di-GMP phosphodiesterase-like protein
MGEIDRYDLEARKVLDAVNASPLPACSAAQVSMMHKLIMQEELSEDAGKMRDGRIACSANLSQSDLPKTQFELRYVLPDGTRYYRTMPPYKAGSPYTVAIQKGDTYVVVSGWSSGFLSRYIASSPFQFSAQAIDAQSGHELPLFGNAIPSGGAIFNRNVSGHVGDTLYSTRCSGEFSKCVTSFEPVGKVMAIWQTRLDVSEILGGMIGSWFGVLFSMVYRRSRSTAQQLRRAILSGSLRVVYQPIVDLASRRIVGAEALARWTDEEGFVVEPEFFIRLAEQRGFIGSITRFVLRQALNDLGAVLKSNSGFCLSVNVTAADLSNQAFLPALKRTLDQAGVGPGSLAIEITESSTVRRDLAMRAIAELRQSGHRVHIDDFGTGYSSLSYLSDLAVDAIKIDKAFTRAIGTSSVMDAILPQILSMAESLHLHVIAEGVETEEQAKYLTATGRNFMAQGWLFGFPCTAEEFLRLIEEDKASAESERAGVTEKIGAA